jgi:hypothetical protein
MHANIARSHPTTITCEVTVSSIHVRSGNAPSLLTNVKNPRARKLHCRAGVIITWCKGCKGASYVFRTLHIVVNND